MPVPPDPTSTSGARGPIARFLLRLTLAVGGAALGLVAAELGFRAYLAATAGGYSSTQTREAIERARGALAGGVGTGEQQVSDAQLSPLLGWWDSLLRDRVDLAYRRGSRSALRHTVPRAERETYDVWILGGSVAALFGRPDVGGAGAFAETVNADPRFAERSGGRRLRVLGFGHASYKQPQQANLVTLLMSLGLEPDAILNLDGFNEVAVAMANADHGVHPAYPSYSKWGGWARNPLSDPAQFGALVDTWNARTRTKELADLAIDRGLARSAVLGVLLRGRIEAARNRWSASVQRYADRSLSPEAIPALRGPELEQRYALDAMLRVWFESSRVLQGICDDRDIFYFHALQPTLHDEGMKPWTEEEQKTSRAPKSWMKGVQGGYPRLRLLGARLAKLGVAFFDASPVFAEVEETLYYDACHFNRRGNEILGRAMGRAFVEQLAERGS